MTIRTLLIVAGLAALAGGCTVTTHEYDEDRYHSSYGVFHEDDSYEGYYYTQIVYIDGDPWYVDEYRRARPIPRQLRSHFQYSSWTRSLPPRFSSDTEAREGYPLARIVYINDVPHYVDDDRRARPVPTRLRSQFSYQSVMQPRDAGRNGGERRRQPVQPGYDNEARPMPPAYGRERERQEPPAYGREREREVPSSYGRERERTQPPSYGAEPMPKPATMPERTREEQQGRQAPPSVRNGRSGPAGPVTEQPSDREAGRGRPMPQENSRKANDDQRAGGADDKKNGKATGRGKGRDENGREEGNDKGAKQRGE